MLLIPCAKPGTYWLLLQENLSNIVLNYSWASEWMQRLILYYWCSWVVGFYDFVTLFCLSRAAFYIFACHWMDFHWSIKTLAPCLTNIFACKNDGRIILTISIVVIITIIVIIIIIAILLLVDLELSLFRDTYLLYTFLKNRICFLQWFSCKLYVFLIICNFTPYLMYSFHKRFWTRKK